MQLSQLAVSHVVNAFYSTPEMERPWFSIPATLERWWTNKISKFESEEHYWSIKQRLLDGLHLLLMENKSDSPLILFEQHQVFVQELQVELMHILQLVLRTEDGEPSDYMVRKYIVDEDEDMIALFQHLTTVFCASAFGRLPMQIEVLSVLSGNRLVTNPSSESLQGSIDYMKLVTSLMPEVASEPMQIRKTQGSAECRRCPFLEECIRPAETAEAVMM